MTFDHVSVDSGRTFRSESKSCYGAWCRSQQQLASDLLWMSGVGFEFYVCFDCSNK